MRRPRVLLVALAATAAVSAQTAPSRPIDTGASSLTVYVYKAGIFSTFADNHVIRAPIDHGSISLGTPLGVDLAIHAADMKVLDPDLSADKRADVQTRMLGPDVLDAAKYAEITFVSSAVQPAGERRWTVTGKLTIHGVTRDTSFPVTTDGTKYRGTVLLKQRDFAIKPISLVGGTVKVKDELKIVFEIAAR